MTEIGELYERLRRAPFPTLGKQIGDFALYDSMLAGYASRASQGETVPATEIPTPDEDTTRHVAELQQKCPLSEDETAFLRYFELLEQIRRILLKQPSSEEIR